MDFRKPVVSLTLMMAVILLGWSSQALAQRGGARARVVSPEVVAGGKVAFRIAAPQAESVTLGGTDLPGLGQRTALAKNDSGVWEVVVGPVDPPGSYRYNFQVDGVSVIDPVNPKISESNANTWSLVHIPGLAFQDIQNVPHGAVASVTYYSKSLQAVRRMHVYTPPGYEAGQASYPVFYLLHGASDSDDSWTSVGCANFILDNLIAAGKAKPMIVVMPAGHTESTGTMVRTGDDPFVTDFCNDIRPYIEKNYRVRTDRQSRAIAGLSMGGQQTLNVAIPHLGDYAYVGVFSSGVFSSGIFSLGGMGGRGGRGGAAQGPSWDEQNKATLDSAQLKDGLKLIWFATGRDDFLVETSRATVALLRSHGFDVTFNETDGAHTWMNWRDYLHEFAPLLFQ